MSHNLPTQICPHTQCTMHVKEKSGGTQTNKLFQVKLQGEVLYALEKRAKELGLARTTYIKECVEKELVKSGTLPNWWFTRNRQVIP